MTTAQVVETSVTVNNNGPIQDYIHPDDQTQPTFEILLSHQSPGPAPDLSVQVRQRIHMAMMTST